MKSHLIRSILVLAVTIVCSGAAASARSKDVLKPDEASSIVAVTDESSQPGVVCGTVMNKSDRPVRDVELLVRHQWLWNDERHPGSDNPGTTSRVVVQGEIPPGEGLPFNSCTNPPLPSRSDGHFKTSTEVVGFTEVGVPPAMAGTCGCGGQANLR